MRRFLSLLLAVGFLASFIGHGLAHSASIKEDACLLCCAAPRAVQARPAIAVPMVFVCGDLTEPDVSCPAGVIAACAARAPPR